MRDFSGLCSTSAAFHVLILALRAFDMWFLLHAWMLWLCLDCTFVCHLIPFPPIRSAYVERLSLAQWAAHGVHVACMSHFGHGYSDGPKGSQILIPDTSYLYYYFLFLF